ncbi:MAG: cytochrome c oxidase subunit 3 [Bacteroidota bacterium]|nr:cytochrome c oxidase subunit 3 [Bacteroidota bacterium]
MTSNTIHNDEPYLIHPKKFVMWLFIVASVMLFAGFTSAYIVRRGEGNWELFNLPSLFGYTTILIVISSVFIQMASAAAKKDNIKNVKLYLRIAFAFALTFCVGQYFGWKQLVADNVYFAFSNPSNSFVYVITGVHLAHVIGGMVFMLSILIQTYQLKVNKDNTVYINMCTTYWHFVGILWVYLYVFLYLYR